MEQQKEKKKAPKIFEYMAFQCLLTTLKLLANLEKFPSLILCNIRV